MVVGEDVRPFQGKGWVCVPTLHLLDSAARHLLFQIVTSRKRPFYSPSSPLGREQYASPLPESCPSLNRKLSFDFSDWMEILTLFFYSSNAALLSLNLLYPKAVF